MTTAALSVEGLDVVYDIPGHDPFPAVKSVTFQLAEGEFVGLVGESGSGKSTLGYALTRLSERPARISGGRILFDGVDVAQLSQEQVRRQRQGGFAMVLQAGMNALNPVRTVRNHFEDIFRAHGHVPATRHADTAASLIDRVGLPTSALRQYPGELSGGMRQRVAIALALSLQPRLMVFDEPTTALDVLVQKALMDTITSLQRSEKFTAILISHDLGVVLEATQRVLVMHDGVLVEDSDRQTILAGPRHPYTRMLLGHYADPRAERVALPGITVDGSVRTITARVTRRAPGDTAQYPGKATPADPRAKHPLTASDIVKVYPGSRRSDPETRAVDHVTFTLDPGTSMALVGASGSGKSTIAKLISGVEKPTSGAITFGQTRIDRLRRPGDLRRLHHSIQMIFQDPYAALNPLHTVLYTLARPLANFLHMHGDAAREETLELLDTVGLDPAERFIDKLPHQLSGGQRQRVVIARALASRPEVIIADEPTSMLDVSLRAGILTLLEDLRVRSGVSMLYITHDLLSARIVTDKIMVMDEGRIVENGTTSDVLRHPQDPYTIRLLDAVPNPTRSTAQKDSHSPA